MRPGPGANRLGSTRVVVVGAALPEDEISKIQVLETWLGGKAVYHAC